MNKKFTVVGFLFSFAFVANANAESRSSTEARGIKEFGSRSGAISSTAERNIRDVRSVIKESARTHIEHSTQSATGGRAVVTSRDRPSGPLSSAAHDRGAIDVNVRGAHDLHTEANNIARQVGPGHTVIVEEPGRIFDKHTSYKVAPPLSDVQTNTYQAPKRATGTHIHIQPNYGIRPQN